MFGISGSAASPPRLFVLGVFVMVAISMPSAAMSTATCPQCNDTHSCARPDLAYVECPVSTHQCVASFKGCHGSVRMLEAYCEPKAAQVLCSVASDQVCCSDPENAQCRARLMAFLKDNRSCDVVTEPPQRTSPLSSSTNLHKGSDGMPTEIVVVVSVLASLVFIGLLLLIGYVAVRKQRQAKGNGKIFVSPSRFPIDIVTSEAISDDSGCDMGESSGRGILQLEERTISREIDLLDQIGTGRFGEVYRGRWREDQVAVKIFKTIEEASFFREVELFNTCMLRHENILGFRAADNRDFNMETQLWMVLDYHCNGSLYDYLRRHSTQNPSPNRKCLGLDDLHKMALSIAAGVMHLHNHIDGQSFGNKPGIAHRDLKSKNILVKQDGTCCIADLGMAVRHNPSQNAIHFLDKDNLKVGTKRYMAPEILDGSINPHVFESFRMVDIYALALVLWEIATVCCPSSDELPTYKFPFEESVPGDPSVEDMYGAVCVRKLRPSLPDHWLENKKLAVLVRIIRTSWKEEPQSRFAVHRIWRNLQSDVAAATSTDNALISPV
eukprot:scpid38969/ scgid1515/ TGF-beta receptor type-1; Serine/threonine-protein kinase receptor R4; TGF-beta type I receptor; Transforming growth factor-beta receptor type I